MSRLRFARRLSVVRRPFAFLSVAVIVACLFPGLPAQAQDSLALPGDHKDLSRAAFVSERLTSVTLPEATGGTPPYTYSVSGASLSQYGLSFDAGSRVLSGTIPDSSQWTDTISQCGSVPCVPRAFDYTVTDSDGDTVTVTGEFTAIDFPAGFLPTPEDLHFAPDTAITPVTLDPTAHNIAYTYALTGLPPGLSFNAGTRVLSGTPTEEGTTTATYTATDNFYTPTITHTVEFDITVAGPLALPAPNDLNVTGGRAIDPVTLPTATGGTAPYSYALTGLPPGLTFDPVTRILSGTPTEEGATTLTYTVTDGNGNAASATFTVTVGDLVDDPIAVAEVEVDGPYAAGEAISVTLPAATDGTPPHSYALAGPDGAEVSEAVPGLTFDPATRVLSGTPTRAGVTTLTYTATDGYGNAASATFAVTITATGVIPAALNEVLLPEVARAMADSTVGAIARRIEQAARGGVGPKATGLSLGGQSGLAALRTQGEAASRGRRDVEALLAGSGFVLPLDAAGGATTGFSSVVLWGSGAYGGLSGESGTLDWDGRLAGVHLGVDARPHEDLLAGVAVSRLESDLDYEIAAPDGGLGEGVHAVTLTGVYPYLGWRAGAGVLVWATAGYGKGALEITPTGRESRRSDIAMRTVGAGGSGVVHEHGVSTVRLKGEVMHSILEVDDSAAIEGMEVQATRVRMAVEAGQTHVSADGGVFEPSVEVGVRQDGGDGETGNGVEMGGGLSWRHPGGRLTAEGRVRTLVAGGDAEEWGIEGHVGVSADAQGRGLSLSVRPGYGDSRDGGVEQLWRAREGMERWTAAPRRYSARLVTRLGYGLFVPGYAGVFTPYTGMTAGAAPGYRIGVNWRARSGFDVDLLGERRESAAGPAAHALMLRGAMRF